MVACRDDGGHAPGNRAHAAEPDGLSGFVATYQCSLAGLIAKIAANRNMDDTQDRFIILSLPRPIAAYVQCAFDHRDREGVCEASSGYFNIVREQPHFTPDQRAALARLGFSTDGSHGNFRQPMHFPPDGPDPEALAGLMLRALYEGYGARTGMAIEVEAPFALRHGYLWQQRCVAIR